MPPSYLEIAPSKPDFAGIHETIQRLGTPSAEALARATRLLEAIIQRRPDIQGITNPLLEQTHLYTTSHVEGPRSSTKVLVFTAFVQREVVRRLEQAKESHLTHEIEILKGMRDAFINIFEEVKLVEATKLRIDSALHKKGAYKNDSDDRFACEDTLLNIAAASPTLDLTSLIKEIQLADHLSDEFGIFVLSLIKREFPDALEGTDKLRASQLFGVLDGAGGNPGGATASRLVALLLAAQASDWVGSREQIQHAMKASLRRTGDLLREASLQAQGDENRLRPSRPRTLTSMATTACIGRVVRTQEGETYFFGVNIGDSQAYYWNQADQTLTLLTEDRVAFIGLPLDEYAPQSFEQHLEKGDFILLTTDFLSKNFKIDELKKEILIAQRTQKPIAQHLIEKKTLIRHLKETHRSGLSDDDAGVVIVGYEE